MKSLSYTVYQDKIVCVVVDNNKTKTLNIIRDDSNLLGLEDCYLDWDGTVVDAIRSLLFKLHIRHNVCMIETINASPDCVWNWKQKHLVHINSRYSFMYVMGHPSDVYNDWKMFDKVFSLLNYSVFREEALK